MSVILDSMFDSCNKSVWLTSGGAELEVVCFTGLFILTGIWEGIGFLVVLLTGEVLLKD